jgi:hypothetical protein
MTDADKMKWRRMYYNNERKRSSKIGDTGKTSSNAKSPKKKAVVDAKKDPKKKSKIIESKKSKDPKKKSKAVDAKEPNCQPENPKGDENKPGVDPDNKPDEVKPDVVVPKSDDDDLDCDY